MENDKNKEEKKKQERQEKERIVRVTLSYVDDYVMWFCK